MTACTRAEALAAVHARADFKYSIYEGRVTPFSLDVTYLGLTSSKDGDEFKAALAAGRVTYAVYNSSKLEMYETDGQNIVLLVGARPGQGFSRDLMEAFTPSYRVVWERRGRRYTATYPTAGQRDERALRELKAGGVSTIALNDHIPGKAE